MRHAPFLLFLLLCAGCDAQSAAPPRSEFAFTATGRIDSASEARRLVGAVDGPIDRVLVDRGAPVREGQPLMNIQCRPKQEEVGVRRAALAEATARHRRVSEGARSEERDGARAEVAIAAAESIDRQQQVDDANRLIGKGFMSRRETDARHNQRDAGNARLATARAKLAEMINGPRNSDLATATAARQVAVGELRKSEAMAADCTIKSPIDGVVLSVLKREGEASGASNAEPVMIVGDPKRIIVRAEINERDVAAARVGQKVQIWIDDGRRWRGRVAALAGVMGRRTARSLDPTDRFDRDTLEAYIAIDGPLPPNVVGLRVTVGFWR